MSGCWLFKGDEPASPELRAAIDRTNDEIRRAAGKAYERAIVKLNRATDRQVREAMRQPPG